MQERHFNRDIYFTEQSQITKKIVLPYITAIFPITSDSTIFEIGCAEAGNLSPFLEMGCKVTGIDISEIRIERARKFYADHPLKKNLTFIAKDIFLIRPEQIGKFDLIILRDTLEHIQNQEKCLSHIKTFLKPDGKIFLSFPPWQMPFGGHQQMSTNSFLSKIPYFHLLPKPFYIGILKLFGEKQYRIDELMAIRDTRLSIRKFRQFVKRNNLKIEREDFYLINPGYEIKFHLKARRLPRLLNIPYFRDFCSTVCYYILSDHNTSSSV